MTLAGRSKFPRSRCRTYRKILEIFKTRPLGWNRTSKTLQRIVRNTTTTMNTLQDRDSQRLKIEELVKQSSRKGRKLIVANITKTVNRHRDRNSQPSKIGETVKQSSRKRRKVIEVEITGTVNTHQDTNSQRLKIGEFVKQSSRKGRKLNVAQSTETVSPRQDRHSQRSEIREFVKQSSRKGRKLIVVKNTKTVSVNSNIVSHRILIWERALSFRLLRKSMNLGTSPSRLSHFSVSPLSEQPWALTGRADSKRTTDMSVAADLIVIMGLELWCAKPSWPLDAWDASCGSPETMC